MSALVLDPVREERYRQNVARVLDELRAVVGDLQGAAEVQIDQMCERMGIERLPVAVDEYMRTVGADYDVCRHMFPGVSGLSMQAVLRAEFDWVFHGGRIPYAVSDQVQWLGPAHPPTDFDVYDPVVWTLPRGSDAPSAGGRFVADLERRVQVGIRGLRELRQQVEACGFCDMDQNAVNAYASAKSAGHLHSMERLLSAAFDTDLVQRMKGMIVESINRDVALYRRLKPESLMEPV